MLMQTTPGSKRNPNWPGYERGKTYFDYLDKYPDAQSLSVGWPENWGAVLEDKRNPELIPRWGGGVQMEGRGPGFMDTTPQKRPDFNKGFSNPWNTLF
jgi:hypothetical protein